LDHPFAIFVVDDSNTLRKNRTHQSVKNRLFRKKRQKKQPPQRSLRRLATISRIVN